MSQESPTTSVLPPIVSEPSKMEVPLAPPAPLAPIQAMPASEASEASEESGVMKFVKRHWLTLTMGVLILATIILIIIGFSMKEHFGDVFYLDQMAMLNTDPTTFKYTGNERDILGESGRDYYLVNQMYANSHAAPQLLEDNYAYINQTKYLDMPPSWRPRPIVVPPETGAPPSDRFVRPIFRTGQSGNTIGQEMGPETSIY